MLRLFFVYSPRRFKLQGFVSHTKPRRPLDDSWCRRCRRLPLVGQRRHSPPIIPPILLNSWDCNLGNAWLPIGDRRESCKTRHRKHCLKFCGVGSTVPDSFPELSDPKWYLISFFSIIQKFLFRNSVSVQSCLCLCPKPLYPLLLASALCRIVGPPLVFRNGTLRKGPSACLGPCWMHTMKKSGV